MDECFRDRFVPNRIPIGEHSDRGEQEKVAMDSTNSRKKWLIAPVVAVVAALCAAAPASAGQGGNPTDGSCGLGKPGAQVAIADPTSPGATENALIKPQDIGCTGHGE
jgi:hypothetical protein